MRSLKSLETRRAKRRERNQRWRSRREARRLNSDEPVRGEWRGKFAFTITYQNRMTGVFHALDFYLSRNQVNSFRVTIDGKRWLERISATDAMAWLRRQLPKFSIR